jgi:hypothetical protein
MFTKTKIGPAGANADFLTGLMEQHEKAAWMLRAQLQSEEEETL